MDKERIKIASFSQVSFSPPRWRGETVDGKRLTAEYHSSVLVVIVDARVVYRELQDAPVTALHELVAATGHLIDWGVGS